MVYNSGPYALEWFQRLQADEEDAIRGLVAQIAELHNLSARDVGTPDRVSWRYWPDGTHKWKTGVDVFRSQHIALGLPMDTVHPGPDVSPRHASQCLRWLMSCCRSRESGSVAKLSLSHKDGWKAHCKRHSWWR